MMPFQGQETSVRKEHRFGAGQKTAAAYVGCLVIGMLTFHHIAEQEFSSVLTIAVLFQCLSFVLVAMQINNSNSVSGISGKTMLLQGLALGFRLSSTLFVDGYLPLDQTGDMFYQLVDVCSLLMVLYTLRCVYKSHILTYDKEFDTMDAKNMAIFCVALAVVVHPDLNDWPMFDIAWTTSLYLDTVSMLPQLFMSSKLGKVPSFTAHYIAATLASRGFSAWFWYYGAENIARIHEGGGFCYGAAAIIVAHLLQFLLLADFGWYYLLAGFSGRLGKTATLDLNETPSLGGHYDI